MSHGVDDVLVEPREEPKSMLAGKAMADRSLSLRQMSELMSTASASWVTLTLRALPPAVYRRSKTTTSKPRSTSSCAALIPATPPPRMTTRVGMLNHT